MSNVKVSGSYKFRLHSTWGDHTLYMNVKIKIGDEQIEKEEAILVTSPMTTSVDFFKECEDIIGDREGLLEMIKKIIVDYIKVKTRNTKKQELLNLIDMVNSSGRNFEMEIDI